MPSTGPKKRAELKRRKQRHKTYIAELKTKSPCNACDRNFHHSAMKYWGGTQPLSKMALYCIDRINQEISKRTLYCSNCSNYLTFLANPSRNTNAHWIQEKIDYVRSQKDGSPCTDCGESFHFSSMEFDHRPDEAKTRSLSNMERHSLERIKQELLRCDVVCSNCHHIRTWTRLQKNSPPDFSL